MTISYADMDRSPERDTVECRKTLLRSCRHGDKKAAIVPGDEVDPKRSEFIDRLLRNLCQPKM